MFGLTLLKRLIRLVLKNMSFGENRNLVKTMMSCDLFLIKIIFIDARKKGALIVL